MICLEDAQWATVEKNKHISEPSVRHHVILFRLEKIKHKQKIEKQPAQLTLAGFAGLTVRHVIEDVLHGSAVRQVALADLSVGLLSAMALVSVQ